MLAGLRSKVNDRFEFPSTIDMSPYHIDSLKEPAEIMEPDLFELVGVLVHAGTAESGHYYSFIKERPADPNQQQQWFEFNDMDVCDFDPNNIPQHCFGGHDENASFLPPKGYNAYMLFYQRVTAMEAERRERRTSSVGSPAIVKAPAGLDELVAMDNELYLRKYCLLDPAHAAFVKYLIEQLRVITKGTCSDDHTVERELIGLALDHLDKVFARAKDFLGFEKVINALFRVIATCPECCRLALEWISSHHEAARSLLLRCPWANIRRDFANLLLMSLQYLRRSDGRAYGFDLDTMYGTYLDGSSQELEEGTLQAILGMLQGFRDYLHLHGRAWDDYFGLLAELSRMGFPEITVMLKEGFLTLCLELLVVEAPDLRSLKRSFPYLSNFIAATTRKRRPSYAKLIELLHNLLGLVDLEAQPVEERRANRSFENGRYGLSKKEETYLCIGTVASGHSKNLFFLDKILESDQNTVAARNIVKMLVLAEPNAGRLAEIAKTIERGICNDVVTIVPPFLLAALTFCEFSPSPVQVEKLIERAAMEVNTIGTQGGREHLDFFTSVRRLRNSRISRGPFYMSDVVLRLVPRWAPPLLMYWEESVRTSTTDVLQSIMFSIDHHAMDDYEKSELIELAGKNLCRLCVSFIQEQFIRERKRVENKIVESVTAVIHVCLRYYFTADGDSENEEDDNFKIVVEST